MLNRILTDRVDSPDEADYDQHFIVYEGRFRHQERLRVELDFKSREDVFARADKYIEQLSDTEYNIIEFLAPNTLVIEGDNIDVDHILTEEVDPQDFNEVRLYNSRGELSLHIFEQERK